MVSNIQIIPLPDFSDGDATQWPTGPVHKKIDPPQLYLQKLGQLWMKHHSPETIRPGIKYYLDKLPRGYAVYERARPNDANHLDKFVYGFPGPSSKRFNSPNDIWPHLNHLQLNKGVAAGCPCRLCKGGSPRHSTQSSPSVRAETPAIVSEAAEKRKPGRLPKNIVSLPQQHSSEFSKYSDNLTADTLSQHQSAKEISYTNSVRPVDEEGTPIALRALFECLKKDGTLDVEITEPFSMDWCALQAPLPRWIHQITNQASWIPRQGEIVLVVTKLPPNTDIEFRADTQAFEVYDKLGNKWAGNPSWQAAVIGQEPIESIDIADIVQESGKRLGPADSGWRIEPLPEANQPNKSLTTRYKYVSTKHIRPFALRHRILRNIPSTQWDPTIWNAMLVQSSVVVIGHHRLEGKWPKANISCTGIYIGSEFITLDDAVTLRPNTGEALPTILEVHAIRIEYSNLDSEDGGYSIFLEGKAFTTDRSAPNAKPVLRRLPASIRDYDIPLYLRHDESRNLRVSFNRVLGRCPEAKAMRLWLPVNGNPSLLNIAADSVLEAREYSTKRDVRILGGKSWHWANTRLSALDIPSLNGVSASHSDPMREERVEEGQKAARVLARPSAKNQADLRQVVERPKTSAAEGAMGMMRAAVAPLESDAEQGDPQLMSGDESMDTPRLQSPARDHKDEHEDEQDEEDTIKVVSPSRKRSASTALNTMDISTPRTSRQPESANSSDEFADAPMLLGTVHSNKRSKPIVDS